MGSLIEVGNRGLIGLQVSGSVPIAHGSGRSALPIFFASALDTFPIVMSVGLLLVSNGVTTENRLSQRLL